MEIIERDENSRDGLVQIAFAETREEAALIRGLLRNEEIRSLAKQASVNGRGLGAALSVTGSSRRIYVTEADADAARAFLAETMIEEPPEEEIPEPANARYLADATGHKPRDYNPIGGLARAWFACAAIFVVALVLFILLH